jgi:glycerol kinase
VEGLGLHTEPAHLVRAMVEGLAAQVALLARAAADDLGRPLLTLRVDGGLTRSTVLMQLQADLLQIPVEVFGSPDATALGVAALARLGAAPGTGLDGAPLAPGERFEPVMAADEAAERLARFEGAARRAIEASGDGGRG